MFSINIFNFKLVRGRSALLLQARTKYGVYPILNVENCGILCVNY